MVKRPVSFIYGEIHLQLDKTDITLPGTKSPHERLQATDLVELPNQT
jgi:hypothetical protein